MNKIRFSLIIPCFNEEKNLPLIAEKLDRIGIPEDCEVLFVNNGSTDQSAEVFQTLSQSRPWMKVLTLVHNEGYGNGIHQGLLKAQGNFLGWTHADMQTDPGDPFKALKILEDTSDPEKVLVKGLRQGRSFPDSFFTVGMSCFETLYLRRRLWDINAQPNVFSRSLLKHLSDAPKDFSYDLFVLYIAICRGFRILRFPVVFPPRVHGTSSWNTGMASRFKFIRRTLAFSKDLKEHLRKSKS